MSIPFSSHAPGAAALRAQRERRTRRLLANRTVAAALLSVAGLTGRPVRAGDGEAIGRVVDLVARWDGAAYPPVTGLVVRVGFRRVFVPIEQVADLTRDGGRLATTRLDLRDFRRREGEVLLGRDVIDHQLVDVDGARVVRASDLYLARLAGLVQLVGVDVGFGSILRRLGPARFRTRPTPEKVVDWASIASFGSQHRPGGTLQASATGLQRLRPGELADLLEDLGRTERRELLAALPPERAADALEEMQHEELVRLLREFQTADAARLLGRMEPDEAADGLRELGTDERATLMAAMPTAARERVATLLGYGGRTAGGVMTTLLMVAVPTETVARVRERLREHREHDEDLAGVVVVDDEGRLVDDLTMTELFLADPQTTVDELIGPPWPVTVTPDARPEQIGRRLVESRHWSVVVVDDEQRPVGRILPDDVLDVLLPDHARFHFPRRLR